MKINNKNIFILMNNIYLAIDANDSYIISTDANVDKNIILYYQVKANQNMLK